MNCKQAQRDIALWAGHDLDDAAQQEAVRRHVSCCPGCRTHYTQMKQTLQVLERAERPVTYVSTESLWPELATRIKQAQLAPPRQRTTQRLQGWMPFVAMTAACLIFLVVVSEQPQQHAFQPIQPLPAPVVSERPSIDSYAPFSEGASQHNPHKGDQRLKLLDELNMNELQRRILRDEF